MNSKNNVIGRLELKWVDVATLLAAKLPSLYYESGASFDESLDEFVLRQTLREVLINCVSRNFVTTKEVQYEGSMNRIDLTIGTSEYNHLFCVELKSNAGKIKDLVDDWNKLRDWKGENKLSIYGGVISAKLFRQIESELDFKSLSLEGAWSVHKIAKKFMTFSSLIDGEEEELVAYTWIWSVGKQVSTLPKFEFTLIRAA